MASLGSIYVDLIARTGKLDEGTKKAAKQLDKFAKDVGKYSDTAAKSIGAVAAAFGFLAIKQSAVIDENAKIARTLGIANEEFQALVLLAKEAGVDTGSLTSLITKSQKALVQGAGGAKELASSFKDLGLNINELLGMSPDKQFEKIVEAISKIENPTLRTATAMQIFGKSGRDVLNLIEEFPAKLQEAREFNDRFGISVSNIDARKVEEARDTFERLGEALGGLGNIMAVKLSPVVTDLSNALLDSGINGESAAKAIDAAFMAIGGVIDYIRDQVRATANMFLLLAKILAEVTTAYYEFELSVAELKDNLFNTDTTQSTVDRLAQRLQASKEWADSVNQSIIDINTNAANTETTFERISVAQAEATVRAMQARFDAGNFNPKPRPQPIEIEDTGETERRVKELNSLYDQNRKYILGVDDATLKYQDTQAELNKLLDAGKITTEQYGTAQMNLQTEFEKSQAKANAWGFNTEEIGKQASRSLQSAFADYLFNPFEDGIQGMLSGFIEVVQRMIAEAAAANLLQSLFGSSLGSGGGFLGSIFGGLGGIFGASGLPTGLPVTAVSGPMAGSLVLPTFAEGGFLDPGKWGIAGEEEAELIYGGRTGMTIIPQAKMGGGGGNTYYIDATGADQGTVRRLETALLNLAGPGRVEQRVADANRRGERI